MLKSTQAEQVQVMPEHIFVGNMKQKKLSRKCYMSFRDEKVIFTFSCRCRMAEAKGRNSTPVIPSDMQSVLKRCENLEKEVRSLKLNLSFMNRKDSEQTKQIEELQKQNEDLMDEKERLVEEILSETGNI